MCVLPMYPCGHCEQVTKSHSTRSGFAPCSRRLFTVAAEMRLSTGGGLEASVVAVSVISDLATAGRDGTDEEPSRKPLRICLRGWGGLLEL